MKIHIPLDVFPRNFVYWMEEKLIQMNYKTAVEKINQPLGNMKVGPDCFVIHFQIVD